MINRYVHDVKARRPVWRTKSGEQVYCYDVIVGDDILPVYSTLLMDVPTRADFELVYDCNTLSLALLGEFTEDNAKEFLNV